MKKHTVVKHVRTLRMFACDLWFLWLVYRATDEISGMKFHRVSELWLLRVFILDTRRYIALFPDIYVVAFFLNNILNETGK